MFLGVVIEVRPRKICSYLVLSIDAAMWKHSLPCECRSDGVSNAGAGGDHSWRFAYRVWSNIESTFLLECWIVWIFYLLQKITFHYSAGVFKLHTWPSSGNVNGVIYRQSVGCTSENILYHHSLTVYPKRCVHSYKSVIIWHIQSFCRGHSQYIYSCHVYCHISGLRGLGSVLALRPILAKSSRLRLRDTL